MPWQKEYLASLIIKGVAVSVVRRETEAASYVSVFLVPAEDLIVRNVAPNQIASDTVPRRTLSPKRPTIETYDWSVADLRLETTVQCNDISFRVTRGLRIRRMLVEHLGERFRGSARSKRCDADLAYEIPASSQLLAFAVLCNLCKIHEPMLGHTIHSYLPFDIDAEFITLKCS